MIKIYTLNLNHFNQAFLPECFFYWIKEVITLNERLLDYIKELEMRLLDSGEELPSMREDIKHLLVYEDGGKI